MIKSRGTGNKADVTFVLDAAVGAEEVSVCGDFNAWSGVGHAMVRAEDGSFRLTIALETGRRYRFRYLLDGDRWENDWAADEYVPNDFGGDDSLVDLTALAEEVPPVAKATTPPSKSVSAKKAPAKNAPAKATTPPSNSGSAKKAPAKKAPAKNAPAKKAPAKKAPAKRTRD
ncbi:MAG: hypothetical protein NVS3B12_03130 [Acidimicrobiales bacterium]